MSPKVVVTATTFPPATEPVYRPLRAAGLEVVVNPRGRKLSVAESAELLGDAVGVIAGTSLITEEVLAAAPLLRVISRSGVGLDNIDLAAAERAGVSVRVAAGCLAESVAEFTIGLMLDTLRHISEADRQIRTGRWVPLVGSLLGTRTVGIVGLGRIGQRVAPLLAAFGCRLLACDPGHPPREVVEANRIEMRALDDLLAEADLVTLHVPFSAGTRLLIDERRIELMQPGSFLVNASRGGIVDEDAVVRALESGALGGAAFDTFSTEPYTGPLLQARNCVVTTHMGSYSVECRAAMEAEAVDNLLGGLADAGVLEGPQGPGGSGQTTGSGRAG